MDAALTRPSALSWRDAAILGLLLLLGCGLRLHQTAYRAPMGDENLYVAYLNWTKQYGFLAYPDLVDGFLNGQREAKEPMLPPTRVVFVAVGRALEAVTGWPAIEALRSVSRLSSMVLLLSIWWLAYLLRGPTLAHLSLLLLTVSPLQLHSIHFAFVDAVFALAVSLGLICVALLQTGRVRLGSISLALALPLIVLTKESAVFALPALALMLIWPWRQLNGSERRQVIFGLVVGAVLTALVVGIFFGSALDFLSAVLLLAAKTKGSQYSATYQNGPWFRYILDYLLVSPVILLGFVACAARVGREMAPAGRMLLVFLGVTLVPMSMLEAGFNLRFALMWDPVVRIVLAGGILLNFADDAAGRRRAFLAAALLAAADLCQYCLYFSDGLLYDPVTLALLRMVGIYRGDYVFFP